MTLNMYRFVHYLPLFGLLILAITVVISTSLTIEEPMPHWARLENERLAVEYAKIPFISDTGVDGAAYFVFAIGLTVSAGILWVTFRLVFVVLRDELSRSALAASQTVSEASRAAKITALAIAQQGADTSQQGAANAQQSADTTAAAVAPTLLIIHVASEAPVDVAVDPAAAGGSQETERDGGGASGAPEEPAAVPWPWRCACCCCCCTLSAAQQNSVAFWLISSAAVGLVLLGWCSETIFLPAHLVGAALVFIMGWVHMFLILRVDAYRVARLGPRATRRDRLWLLYRRACNASLLVLLCVFAACEAGISLPGPEWMAERQFFAYISPLMEWAYTVGVLGAHVAGLGSLLELREWDAGSFRGALRGGPGCMWASREQ